MRVLIVDDSPVILKALTAWLHHAGHETAEASNVAEAVPLIPYVDAVICDGLGGAWKTVRHEVGKDAPFVLFAGDTELWSDALALDIPAVLKGDTWAELLAAIGGPAGAAK
jgi:DNA-binding response OmpR family regulator